jgi:hypothetical protein
MAEGNGFYWERHPEVEAFFLRYLNSYRGRNGFLADFENRLIRNTSSGILNWIDHILVGDGREVRRELMDLGFRAQENAKADVFYHPGVMLPSVLLTHNSSKKREGVALRVESIESFLRANGLEADIEGPAKAPCRRASINIEDGTAFRIVERRGTRDSHPAYPEDGYSEKYARGVESWKRLPRNGSDEEKILDEMSGTVENLVASLGVGTAAHIVCECERDYWLARNSAGRAQKKRQDALGVGWGNHDHHTFRSSRRNFRKLIDLFLRLGFHKRERFYAGMEAGWGAQVMEHTGAGLALFLDVDLSPEEVDIDFSVRDLEEREALGTVGLWCALHGDSILKAGMHHLAARFDFERLTEDLAKQDIRFMAPFSDFSYLKQAFSAAEMWTVDPGRIRKLLDERRISSEEADKFLMHGSVGSHLENIERREGYKGFNRKNVSAIIRETDPRKG